MLKKKTVLRGREVEYTVKKSSRARHLRLAVYCDASVVVTVPQYFGEWGIDRFLKAKSGWLLGKIDYFLRTGKTIPTIRRTKRDYKKYREQARAFVHERVEKLNAIYNFSFNKIFIKNHKSRWGSCSIKKNLNFNYKIIFLPERLAEYIVAHELCHLGEFNHSHKFWSLVERTIPDCKLLAKQVKKQVL